jgi:Tfp pilus assembly protein PilF
MSSHLTRAQLLLQQARPADAEKEVMLALAQQPDHPLAHAYLALTRIQQGRPAEALESARAAIALAPDVAFFHYVHALVLHRGDRDKEALLAIDEAIRLDPEEESHFAMLASIRLALREWTAALEAAERGLALNPENVECANLRSMALVRLGRKSEAMATVDYALEREPDNAISHANQGWNCLHRNDPKRAQEYFREALRLNPELEYARQGMLEALKARNPVYRVMLAYFLWMARLSGRMQGVFVVGTYFVIRGVRQWAGARPDLGYVLWPVVVLFYAFVYLSWTAVPMFNLLLRLDRFGRLVLSREERVASNWYGACFFATVASLITWAATGREEAMFGAIVGAMLSVCAAVTFYRTGKKRIGFASASIALAVCGLGALVLMLSGYEQGYGLLVIFLLGFFGFQVAANLIRG